MKLKTDRLILRRFTDSDTEAMAAINADPLVMECFPAPMSRAATLDHLKRTKDHWAANNFGLFAIEHRDTQQMIGFTGLTIPPYPVPATPCVEIGWRLTPSAWGQGLASEAAIACLHWGFTTLNLSEIVSFTFVRNTRSRRLMSRLGMTRSQSDDFDHPWLDPDSPLLRHVLYRIKRPDLTLHQGSADS